MKRPPSKWLRSTSGVPARVITSTKRGGDGSKLYRLDYGNVRSSYCFTLSELQGAGVRWLKNKPRDWKKAARR